MHGAGHTCGFILELFKTRVHGSATRGDARKRIGAVAKHARQEIFVPQISRMHGAAHVLGYVSVWMKVLCATIHACVRE